MSLQHLTAVTLRFRITATFEAVFDIGGGFVMDDWMMEKVLCYRHRQAFTR
jgi:hypothetical protein